MGDAAGSLAEEPNICRQRRSSAPGDSSSSKLDAGALFVLQSKGSWVHCGYHLTTSIVAPALLSLPLAFAFLGWGPGILCLTVAAVVTFYSYNLLSLVLEHHAQQGTRLLRFRDLAFHVLGRSWARYYVGPIQFLVCYGAVIGNILLGGQSLKSIYSITTTNARPLYQFVVLFGGFMLLLAQIPSFHSLRYVNLVSLVICLAYSSCATAGSILLGRRSATPKDYSLSSNGEDRIFGVFTGIAIIATTYGNGIIPEIQATIAAPVKGKMFKGLCLCYAVVICTFFAVAISGYWAFGNKAEGVILSNFIASNSQLPRWFLILTYACVILQLSAVAVVRMQSTRTSIDRLIDCKKFVGVPATHQRNSGSIVRRPGKGSILPEKRHPQAPLPVAFHSLSHDHRRHAAIFRRRQCRPRRVWVSAPGLRLAGRPVQRHLPTVPQEHLVLGQHHHSHRLLHLLRRQLHLCHQADRSRCKGLPLVCKCLDYHSLIARLSIESTHPSFLLYAFFL